MDTYHDRATARNNFPADTERNLRAELALLQARYDCGAVSLALYRIIRALEIELAWLEYRRQP
jgi:hypothetical protein